MNQKQLNTLKRLLNAKYQEYYKNRKKLAEEQANIKFKQAAAANAHLLKEYAEARAAAKKVEEKAKKEGLEICTYQQPIRFSKGYNFECNAINAFEKKIADIKLKIEEKILLLELGDLNIDAKTIYDEMIALFKE